MLDHEFYFGMGRQPFVDAGCNYHNCMTTADRSYLDADQVDAIVWSLRAKDDRSLPVYR